MSGETTGPTGGFVKETADAEDEGAIPWFPEPEAPPETNQRYQVVVKKPKAVLALGQPDAYFGYKGVSLHADDNLFVNVGLHALLQGVGGLTLVQGGTAFWSSAAAMALLSGANTTVASKRQLVLAAGAGYAEGAQQTRGTTPDMRDFDAGDLEEVLEAQVHSVEHFEEEFHGALHDAADKLGVLEREPHKLGSEEYLERLTQRSGNPLARAIGKATGLLERIDRVLSRPDKLPLAGPAYAKLQASRRVLDDLNSSVVATTEAGADALDFEDNMKRDVQQVVKRARKAGPAPAHRGGEHGASEHGASEHGASEHGASEHGPSEHGASEHGASEHGASEHGASEHGGHESAREKYEEGAEKVNEVPGRALDAARLYSTDAPRVVLRPARRVVSKLKEATASLQAVTEGLGQLVGARNRNGPSLGLVASQGITLAAAEKIVGSARGGFYFVAPTKAPAAAKLGFLASMKASLAAGVADIKGGHEEPQVPAGPHFQVRAGGRVELYADEGAELSALGHEGVARVAATAAAEVVGVENAALAARNGAAEILGESVFIGVPPQADPAHAARVLEAQHAALAATGKIVGATGAVVARQAAVTAAQAAFETARAAVLASGVTGGLVGASAGASSGNAVTAGLNAGVGAMALTSLLLDKRQDALAKAKAELAEAQAALDALNALADVQGKTAAAPGVPLSAIETAWNAAKQKPTKTAQVWATDKAELSSGNKLNLHGATEVNVGTVGATQTAAKVSVVATDVSLEATNAVTIKVGNFTVTLKADACEIVGGGSKIALEATKVTLQQGAATAVLENGGFKVNGLDLSLTAKGLVKLG